MRVFPISNWTELDVWQYIAREELELPSIYFAHEREVFERDGMLYAATSTSSCSTARSRSRRVGALPHRRRHDLHRRRALARPPRWTTSSPRSPPPASPSAARPAPTTASPRPRWKTASARATSDGGNDSARRPPERVRGAPAASELLRFATAGSVDDGKSTLIGRLLYDTKQILDDQLAHVEQTSERRGDGDVNLALLTDGLRAEREQGITIDVAYRYFATPRRKFIIADTPGHVQYTRNMVTGASTADLAIVLVDARQGVVEQTRRHTFIASLLRIPHLVVASTRWTSSTGRGRFDEIVDELTDCPRGWTSTTSRSSRSARCTATTSSTRSDAHALVRRPPLLYHLEHVTSRPTAT